MAEDHISELYEQLEEAIDALNDEQVVKIADEILKANSNDKDALRCKIVAQIQLGLSFPETSSLFGRLDEETQRSMALERAYCMYRMGKLDDAQQTLSKASDPGADHALLSAQILYRQGRFQEAASAFESVLKTHGKAVEHPADVRSNIIASYVSGGRSEAIPSVLEALKVNATSAGFEAAFNVACGLLEEGRYEEAGTQLEVAARLGREQFMEDDMEEGEIEIELAPVHSQSAFLQFLRGDVEGAKKALERIVGDEGVKDSVTLAVAHNNLIAAKARFLDIDALTGLVKKGGPSNPKDLLRVLERVTESKGALSLHLPTQLDQRLSERQKCALHCNRALLLMMVDKVEDARALAQAAAARYTLQDFPALLRAALLAREGKTNKAFEALEEFAQRAGPAGVDLQDIRLLQLQLALQGSKAEDRRRALEVIRSCDEDLQSEPAVLSTALQLCAALGVPAVAEELLQAAVQREGDSERKAVMLLELGDLRSGTGDVAGALDFLERAAGEPGATDSLRSAALGRALRLKAAAGVTLPKGLQRLQQGLPEPASRVDVALLEAASKPGSVAVPVTAAQVAGGAVPMDVDTPAPLDEAARRLARNKRKREKRKDKFLASKGYGPGKPAPEADPERWLPKQERSDFKAKKAKRDAPVKGSQGAGKVDESLDAKKGGAGPSKPAGLPSLPGKKKKAKK